MSLKSHIATFEDLPTELLANVFSYLEYKYVVRTGLVCRALQGLILYSNSNKKDGACQDFWRCLCKMSFRMDEDRFKEWPRINCWYDMYQILNTWVKREGFYSLSQASPWGSLCLFHLEAGKLVGEVLTPCSSMKPSLSTQQGGEFSENCSRGNNSGRTDGVFDREIFFEAEFSGGSVFGEQGIFCGDHECEILTEDTILSKKSPNAVNIISIADDTNRFPIQVTSRLARAENLVIFDPKSLKVPLVSRARWRDFELRHLNVFEALLDLLDDMDRFEELVATNGFVGNTSAKDAKVIWELAKARRKSNSLQMGKDILLKMWEALDIEDFQNLQFPKMLNFEYVDGPSHRLTNNIRRMELMPVIKPGLYCGSYHSDLYMKYHKEIILVEYKRYTNIDLDETWRKIREDVFVFNSRDVNDTISRIKSALYLNQTKWTTETEVVFVVGRKVTGDCHVPAGKCTFGALVYPVLLPNPSPGRPETEVVWGRMDSTSTSFRVIRRWYGWGTIAYPVFNNPSTTPGVLMQLENDSNGNHRFGFFWNGSSDEATVLQWLPIQDKYPWFHKYK